MGTIGIRVFYVIFYTSVIALFSINSHAQVSSKYIQGQLFFKISDHYSINPTFSNASSPFSALPEDITRLINIYGISSIVNPFVIQDEKLSKTYLLSFSKSRLTEQLLRELSLLDYIEYVEKVPLYELFATPNDLHPNQWNLQKIMASNAWDITKGSAAITVAIVDDAVLLNHEDLSSVIWKNTGEIAANGIDDDSNGYIDDINGWDAASNDNNPNPPGTATNSYFTHGTHCAGITGAATDNNKGIASISYNVSIIPVKIADDGNAALTGAYLGVQYAIAAKANVISMSWGGGAYSFTYQNLFNLAHQKGIVVIAAAGNSNTSIPMYPAAYTHVISVGSTTSADKKSSFSNYGPSIDVMAPGSGIWSTLAGSSSSYGYLSGTSMACPLVSGLAALMLSKNSFLTPDELETCLKNSCDDIDNLNSSYTGQLGTGRINVFKALSCLKPLNANFTSDKITVCPGGLVSFKDLSTNNPILWKWSFPGGTPASSILQHPKVTYNIPGKYTVTLVATNLQGSDTIVKSLYLDVAVPTAFISGSATITNGFSANLKVVYKGDPPWNFTYTDGTTNYVISNIDSSFYYISVAPGLTTDYKLISVNNKDCNGIVSGNATIKVIVVSAPCGNASKVARKISDLSGDFTGILNNNDKFGEDVADIGDLDQDGTNDIAVGAFLDDDGGQNRGAVWILFLKPDGKVKNFQKISSTQGGFTGTLKNDGVFGTSVEGIGDMNGDGVLDIAVGAEYDDDGGGWHGAVWILYMNSNGTVKNHQKISDLQGNFTGILSGSPAFGTSIANLGDLNGDGTTDIAVGSRRDDDGDTRAGAVWVLFLNTDGTVKSHQKISALSGNLNVALNFEDFFGPLTSIDDLDKDGVTDIAVGAYLDDDGGLNRGAIYVLFLNANGTVKAKQKISSIAGNFNGGLQNGDMLGLTIESKGDLDGDGNSDLLVSAAGSDDGGADKGAVYVLYLNSNGTVRAHEKISSISGNYFLPLKNGDAFGRSVAILNDLNLDGKKEFAIGAWHDDDGGTDRGAIWILQDSCNSPIAQKCKLKADFFHATACITDSTIFKDTSTDSVYNVVSWKWLFGDGDSTVNVKNPKHRYKAVGNYGVKLIVSNNASPSCVDTFIKTIIVTNQVKVDAGTDITICTGDSIVINSVKISCGQAPFTYAWSPASGLNNVEIASPKASPSAPTKYYVTVKDSTGTTTIDSITVIVDLNCCKSYAKIDIEDSLLCVGQTINISNNSIAKINAVYKWEFGNGASPSSYIGTTPPPITYSVPGIFSIKLILNDNCGEDTSYRIIKVFPLPLIELGSDTAICKGDSITLGKIPVSTHSYFWSPSTGLDNSLVANPLAKINVPITYSLIVKDQATGCSAKDSVKIGIVNKNIPSFSLSDSTLCIGQSLDIINNSAFGSNALYDWSFGTGVIPTSYNGYTPPTIVYQVSGNYKVRLIRTDICGTDTLLKNIVASPLPSADAGNDISICSADSVSIGTASSGGYSYEWKPVTGINKPLVSNPAIKINGTGTYTLSVKDQATGCLNKDSVVVQMINKSKVMFDLSDTTLCFGEKLKIENKSINSGGTTYDWSFGIGADPVNFTGFSPSEVRYTSPGTYMVNLIATGLCGTDTVLKNVEVFPSPIAAAGADTSGCISDTVILGTSSVAINNYFWSPEAGLNNPLIARPKAGIKGAAVTYTLVVTDKFSMCSSRDSVHITPLPQQSVNLGSDTTLCNGVVLTLWAPTWSKEHTWSNNSSSAYYTVHSEGVYYITVNEPCGPVNDTVRVKYKDCNCTIGIPNVFSPNGDNNNDAWSVISNCIVKYSVVIYDRWGEKVFETNIPGEEWDGTYKGKHLDNGVFIYYIEAILATGEFKRKGNISLIR